MPLSDRVAIITGPTGGLGPAMARGLSADGALLGLVGTSIDRLSRLGEELELDPERHTVIEADLRSGPAAAKAVDAIVQRFGRVDILIHLVGGYLGGAPLVEVAAEDVSAMLDQHLWTTFHMTRAVIPRMSAARWGRVIGISSPVAGDPVAKMTPYAVGKAAEEALLRTIAREVAGTGVTVNVLLVRKIDAGFERDREPSPRNA